MRIKHLAVLLPLLAIGGCASTPGGPGPAGTVGASSMIHGVEFWNGGPPARPYEVIDTVSQEGADNSATYADEERLIADEARNRGADAVIVLNSVMVTSRRSVIDGRDVLAPKVEAELVKYK